MVMTVQEIARSYRQAEDKGAQIGILADLNACSKDQIVIVLKGQGITEIPSTSAKRGRKPGGHNAPKLKPKNNTINALLSEGIAAIDEEIEILQAQIDVYKEKKRLLKEAIELEERHGKKR